MKISTRIRTLTAMLAAAALVAPVAQATTISRAAPDYVLAAQAQKEVLNRADARHASLILRSARNRSVESGLIGRPAPAGGLAAQSRNLHATRSPSAPGFDYRDAGIGAAIGLGTALLAAIGVLALRRGRRTVGPA